MTQLELLRFTLDSLERLKLPYAVVGSFASGVWGEPRMTLDIDIVIKLLGEQVDAIVANFSPDEFYISRRAVEEAVALGRPFNVIHPTSGLKIDFMVVAQTGWSATQIARSRRIQFLPGCEGNVAAPEDVILGKLVYYREGGSDKHLRDIAGILRRSNEAIDRRYLEESARSLGVDEIWRRIVDQLSHQ